MKDSRTYKRTLFEESEIRLLILKMEQLANTEIHTGNLAIYRQDHSWNMDNLDDFFTKYNNGINSMLLSASFGKLHELILSVSFPNYDFKIEIKSPNESEINELFSILDNVKDKRNIDRKFDSYHKPPIFIGHGQKNDWKELKDHLRDKHNYEIKFYESFDRSSGYIFDNVAEMINSSKISILVLSNDDTLKGGTMRARQNVIHELGYSQAIQGRKNTLIVVEEGCDWPSNIQGIDLFPYKNSIREIYGDIVAALEKRFFDMFSNI